MLASLNLCSENDYKNNEDQDKSKESPWDKFSVQHGESDTHILIPHGFHEKIAGDTSIKGFINTVKSKVNEYSRKTAISDHEFARCSASNFRPPAEEPSAPGPASLSVITRHQHNTELLDVKNQLVFQQKRDPVLLNLHRLIMRSPQRAITKLGEEFTVKAGLIYAKHLQSGESRLAAPSSMERELILSAHSLAHLGSRKTLERVRQKWYIPKASEKVAAIVKACHTCQTLSTNQKGKNPHHLPPGNLSKGRKSGELVAMDVWAIGPNTRGDFKYIVAAMDLFSRYTWVRNLRSATSEAIARFLIEQVFANYIPHKILSDNANNISGGILPKLYQSINRGAAQLAAESKKKNEENGTDDVDPLLLMDKNDQVMEDYARPAITQITSSPFHPQGNSVIERFFRTFKTWITKCVEAKPHTWHLYTNFLCYLHNNTISRALRTTPNHVQHGIRPDQTYAGLLDILESGGGLSEDSYMRQLAVEIKEAKKLASDVMHQNAYYAQLNKQYYRDHANIRDHDFQVGSYVLVKRLTPEDKVSGKTVWMGPAIVRACLGRYVLLVEYVLNGFVRKRNATTCKPYYYDEADQEKEAKFTGPARRDARYDFPGLVETDDEHIAQRGVGDIHDEVAHPVDDIHQVNAPRHDDVPTVLTDRPDIQRDAATSQESGHHDHTAQPVSRDQVQRADERTQVREGEIVQTPPTSSDTENMPFLDMLSAAPDKEGIIDADPPGYDDLEPEISPPNYSREASEMVEELLDEEDVTEKKVAFSDEELVRHFNKNDVPAQCSTPHEQDGRPKRTRKEHNYNRLHSKGF